MQEGRVRKATNSFFYVELNSGELLPCKMRGKFKHRQGIYAGDLVAIAPLPDGTGVIEKILPRTSLLTRPPIANVEQIILVFAAREPDPSPLLLSRFLVQAEWANVPDIIICINKSDLLTAPERLWQDYAAIGYPILRVSALQHTGLAPLRERLQGRLTVLAGPSGVGKSSLLNALDPELARATGEVSEKIKRGRHTTRVAELLPWQGGYLVDTPGFGALPLEELDAQTLPHCFPEMRPYLGACRFAPCSHSHEPACAVKEAVARGEILEERYAAYLAILEEILKGKKVYP